MTLRSPKSLSLSYTTAHWLHDMSAITWLQSAEATLTSPTLIWYLRNMYACRCLRTPFSSIIVGSPCHRLKTLLDVVSAIKIKTWSPTSNFFPDYEDYIVIHSVVDLVCHVQWRTTSQLLNVDPPNIWRWTVPNLACVPQTAPIFLKDSQRSTWWFPIHHHPWWYTCGFIWNLSESPEDISQIHSPRFWVIRRYFDDHVL